MVNVDQERLTSPTIDGTAATFFYPNRKARKVSVLADSSEWRPVPMERQDDGWSLTCALPLDARAEYAFLVNGQQILDPGNPHWGPGGFGPRSECRMPDYKPPPPISPPQDGRLEHVELAGREVDVYVPDQPRGAAVLVVQDGWDYVQYAGMPGLLDALIAQDAVMPALAVFVSPLDRNAEHNPNEEYIDWLADELLPAVGERYSVSGEPELHGVIGASLGGICATFAAMYRPDAFRLVGAQSPAYRPGPSRVPMNVLIERFAGIDWRSLRVHVDGGTFETNMYRRPYLAFIEDGAARLEAQGCAVQYVASNEGHNWTAWRGRLSAMLSFLLR